MNTWYVYILELKNGELYTGITNNLVNRIKKHQSGKGSKYVRSRLPAKLVYTEIADDKSSALKREASIKKMKRVSKLDLIRSKQMADKKCDKKKDGKCCKDGRTKKKCCKNGSKKQCDKKDKCTKEKK